MAVLSINNVAMPAPTSVKVTIFDVSSSADRNASGEAVIDRVGTKRKLECTWAHLCVSDMARLLSAAGTDVFFNLQYPDPQTAAMRTMTCYCGDRGMGILRMSGATPVWTDVEMSFIER